MGRAASSAAAADKADRAARLFGRRTTTQAAPPPQPAAPAVRADELPSQQQCREFVDKLRTLSMQSQLAPRLEALRALTVQMQSPLTLQRLWVAKVHSVLGDWLVALAAAPTAAGVRPRAVEPAPSLARVTAVRKHGYAGMAHAWMLLRLSSHRTQRTRASPTSAARCKCCSIATALTHAR